MSTRHEKLSDQLEEILEKNRDAEKGYTKAAENADSSNLKSYFKKKASERNTFNTELKKVMMTSYNDIDDDGTFAGTIHRTWMDVKAFFSADDDESMLEEAIRGEKASVEEYDDVLEDTNLPTEIASLVRKQKMQIESDLSKVKTLEDLN